MQNKPEKQRFRAFQNFSNRFNDIFALDATSFKFNIFCRSFNSMFFGAAVIFMT